MQVCALGLVTIRRVRARRAAQLPTSMDSTAPQSLQKGFVLLLKADFGVVATPTLACALAAVTIPLARAQRPRQISMDSTARQSPRKDFAASLKVDSGAGATAISVCVRHPAAARLAQLIRLMLLLPRHCHLSLLSPQYQYRTSTPTERFFLSPLSRWPGPSSV